MRCEFESHQTHHRLFDIYSRSSIGRAAGLYPVSARSARDPSSSLGGSMQVMAGVAQLAERLTVDQIVAGSSPATRPDSFEWIGYLEFEYLSYQADGIGKWRN